MPAQSVSKGDLRLPLAALKGYGFAGGSRGGVPTLWVEDPECRQNLDP